MRRPASDLSVGDYVRVSDRLAAFVGRPDLDGTWGRVAEVIVSTGTLGITLAEIGREVGCAPWTVLDVARPCSTCREPVYFDGKNWQTVDDVDHLCGGEWDGATTPPVRCPWSDREECTLAAEPPDPGCVDHGRPAGHHDTDTERT